MLAHRAFRIVMVVEKHGVGAEPTPTADKTIQYSGGSLSVGR
jgi:hypothetical protein